MFASLSDRLSATFKSLRGKGRLSEADIETTVSQIRRALLDADVAVPAVRAFTSAVRERASSAEVSQALNPAQQIVKIVNEQLIEILGGESREVRFAKHPPTVIMLAGLQGAGKTTLAGKLGKWLKEEGHTPLLVASDLQRPNAVTQLQVVGGQAGVPVWAPEPGNGVGNPIEVARTGVAHAREKYYDVVVVDTAGRLGVDAELMQQAADIRDAVNPDEILFVVDAMIGQDAVTTAQAFADGVGFTGVVLSKLDGDARGGAALSIRTVTGKPVLFASTGEKLTDFERFHPDRMASRILDMGDVLTLIEQAEKAFDEDQAQEMANKIAGDGDFTLQDFLGYMQQMKQLGSMKKMLGMLPGMGQMREQLENFDEREVVRVEAMVQSMTPGERQNPKIINGSRRSRIAKGSGSTVSEINGLLDRFEQAKTMMRSMARGGMKGGMPGAMGGLPGMGGMPGGGKKSRGRMAPPPKRGKKGKSGNPAKRAQQEREAAERAAAGPKAPAGSAFGMGSADPASVDPSALELPKGFEKFLGR
ncbi:signal recognition particle protein [Occultella glacieicola]|uniref:Signal recognition particle protein n=1 Tax=Occultella glacieicola TaxID=2518684 RepID=A0ABY2DWW5_9MICO|nr:signal recognition particle protein [Occultella glacieicola]TDE88269.1 signal recognition particle protein [Occultella glacieicola]